MVNAATVLSEVRQWSQRVNELSWLDRDTCEGIKQKWGTHLSEI